MATTEDTEEKKTPTTSTDIRTAVETAGSADESVQDEDEEQEDDSKVEAGDESGEDDGGEGGEEDDSKSGKSDDDESKDDTKPKKSDEGAKSEYRFTQFAGDGTPESYISNLEKAYENSSAEGIANHQKFQQAERRINAVMDAVRGDKDLADKLHAALTGSPSAASPKGEAAPTTDPFLVNAKNEWERKSTEEAQEFIDANPEVVSNPEINAEVKKWMEVFSNQEYTDKGRLMTAGEAMSKAYKYLGYEDKRDAKKSLSDAKAAVAPTRPQGSRKPAKTASDFTDSQLKMGEMLGLSKEKLDKFGK